MSKNSKMSVPCFLLHKGLTGETENAEDVINADLFLFYMLVSCSIASSAKTYKQVYKN